MRKCVPTPDGVGALAWLRIPVREKFWLHHGHIDRGAPKDFSLGGLKIEPERHRRGRVASAGDASAVVTTEKIGCGGGLRTPNLPVNRRKPAISDHLRSSTIAVDRERI